MSTDWKMPEHTLRQEFLLNIDYMICSRLCRECNSESYSWTTGTSLEIVIHDLMWTHSLKSESATELY